MRVLHVVRQFHPAVGGLEDFVFNLARRQRAEQSIDASVVTLDRVFTDPGAVLAAEDEVAGIPVARMRWRGSPRYPLAPSVLRHVADADLVHVHAVDFFFDFLAATRAYHRKPLVATVHGGFFHSGFLRRAKRVYFHSVTRLSALAYDAIVACSGNDAAAFAPIAASKLTTIENGVDTAKFWGCSSARRTRRLVYFGRFATHKRIAGLFPILAALRRASPEWDLVVAGSPGEQSVGDLAAAAAAAGVGGAVRFVVRPTDAELREVLGGATYFVCASAHEGFGIAAVEAMSAGLIPVLSRIPPFAELLRKAGTGVSFDPAAPEAVAAEVLALDRDIGPRLSSLRDRVMAAAAGYDWRSVAAEYGRVYRDAGFELPGHPPVAPRPIYNL